MCKIYARNLQCKIYTRHFKREYKNDNNTLFKKDAWHHL